MTDYSGEGPDLILFGNVPLPAQTRTHSGYLARPNARGTFPSIVVVPPVYGITRPARTWNPPSRSMALPSGLPAVSRKPNCWKLSSPPLVSSTTVR